MSLLGIDIGTTICKASAFSEDGLCIASAGREYPMLYPKPGEVELESRRIWNSLKLAITELTSKTKHDPITAICVSAMGEAVTPVTKNRKIIGNCILSSDTRGNEYIEELKNNIGQHSFYKINPNILAASYTLPKILFLKEHEPELYDKTYKFLLWGGLAEFMLGCEPFTSYSHANRTLLFDIHKQNWSDKLLSVTGIDREKLPNCLPSGTIAGTVADNTADELGLPHGVQIVVGGHDQCCNALGAGITQAGRAVDGIGTFECITPVYKHIPEPDQMLKHGLSVEHYVLPGLYVSFLFNQAGSLVRWFRNTFAQESGNANNIYDLLNSEMPIEPTRLFVLPFFETTGSPNYVSNASGVIVGLKTNTTRGEILKAIMECTTFYFVKSVEAIRNMDIDTSEFVATGGGAKSDDWLQIKADIFGVPFVRPGMTECGLVGTAVLAGVATGVFRTPEEGIKRFVKRERVFLPDNDRHEIYQERLAKYQELFPLMRDYLSEMETM